MRSRRGHIREGRPGSPLLVRGSQPTLPPPSPPQLDPAHSADVTALADRPAILNCRVHNISNKTPMLTTRVKLQVPVHNAAKCTATAIFSL
ncbi:hypothetical protein E2C01_041956 [Portunus trituberculatus]|uniref:Uncharacterized protein n=1 Tax=Portunus trituberculatus TaxID=210409 RepID=A0A5B7FT96_PORTR|nr:hypothetical protein [Portunus trituberculatus]